MGQRILTKLSFTPTLDTSAYASGDVLHSSAMVVDLSGLRDHPDLWLDSVVVIDKAKQSAALDLVLFSGDVASQTANAAFNPTNTEAATALTWVPITTYCAFNSQSIGLAAQVRRNLVLDPSAAAMKLYGFLISRGAPTYAASSLTVLLKFIALGENR